MKKDYEEIKNYYYDRLRVGLDDNQIARNIGMDPKELKKIIHSNDDTPAEIVNTVDDVATEDISEFSVETGTDIEPEEKIVSDENVVTFEAPEWTKPEIKVEETTEKVKKAAWSDPES